MRSYGERYNEATSVSMCAYTCTALYNFGTVHRVMKFGKYEGIGFPNSSDLLED